MLAAEWVHWLHAGTTVSVVLAPAVGIALAALVLLAPARWPGPLVASALAVGAVTAAHHSGTGLAIGRAVATVAAAATGAVLLRWYAGGRFHLIRVRELIVLVVAATIGAVIGAAIDTVAVAVTADLPSADLWRASWRCALAYGFAMVLVGATVLTSADIGSAARSAVVESKLSSSRSRSSA